MKLRQFVKEFSKIASCAPQENVLLAQGSALMKLLVRSDNWLPEPFAQPSTGRYAQHLLHCDSEERFSVVSFVWGPGQNTPIHNHTVWGLIGMLRGSETSQQYQLGQRGQPEAVGPPLIMQPGDVSVVSPSVGDIHRVANTSSSLAISIHVYGGNIGRIERSTFLESGEARRFVSGFNNATLPNIWLDEPSQ